MNPRWTRGSLEVSCEASRADLELITNELSSSYWAKGITRDVVERSLAGSLCFVLLDGGRQIGFARVVTDRATFAYLADVFVLAAHRGRGLGLWLVECVVNHPELQGLRRWMLGTRDAHGLYEKLGVARLAHPEIFMERHEPEIYRRWMGYGESMRNSVRP